MTEIDEKINELERRLDELIKTQVSFQEKTNQIRYEIGVLRAVQQKHIRQGSASSDSPSPLVDRPYAQPPRTETPPPPPPKFEHKPEPQRLYRPLNVEPPSPPRQTVYEPTSSYNASSSSSSYESSRQSEPSAFSKWASEYAESARANLEEFIGENLISKIGIVVLLLGVGIGVKYAIDNDWISPLMRIVLGYMFGFGLIGFAIRLKAKYLNFSAVLLSGGMASMYFVTYFAYALYGLLGQSSAFGLMVLFTVFTVTAALVYNRQVIAHIGLVGAYAVPFLLSNNSGAYAFLFTYISIVNAGILAVSIKREWRPILYTSSAFTWLIFLGWFASRYTAAENFYLALTFLWIFFAIFYAANIVLGRGKGVENKQDLAIAVVNTLIFFAFCFGINNNSTTSSQFVILFSYLAGVSAMILATSGIPMTSVEGSRKIMSIVTAGPTWLILFAWFVTKYSPEQHFGLALTFVGIFFALFYAAKVLDGIRHAETKDDENLIITLANVFVFYAFTFGISNADFTLDRYFTIFSFLAVMTLAVLIVSLKYYGRAVVYIAYPATWLIYAVWFTQHYNPDVHFAFAVIFASIFFAIFYVTTLVLRLIYDEMNLVESSGLILTNSFVFYGFGYAIMDGREALRGFEGVYTIGHAGLHLAVMQASRRLRPAATDVGHVLLVLVLTFATIAVPIQFDGNRITMIWAVEGALLFWLARLKQIKVFEYFSLPVMALATGSLFVDWMLAFYERTSYTSEFNRQVFANGNFVTALVYIGAFACILVINRNPELRTTISEKLIRPFGYIVAAAWIFVLYNTFRIEIDNYFHLLSVAAFEQTLAASHSLSDLTNLNIGWQIIYSILFFTALQLINLRWIRSLLLSYAALALGTMSVLVFVIASMGIFMELRTSYMNAATPEFIDIAIRWIGYIAAGGFFYSLYRSTKDEIILSDTGPRSAELAFDGLFSITLLVLASVELINIMAQLHYADSLKYGLSVLWGVYALVLIVVGIQRAKKHLRIGAIVLLGITLAKLFIYDISDLPTIPKTILFVSLGILMLIVSFLYTKYKHVIFGDTEEEKL